jgi:hypothetical protein
MERAGSLYTRVTSICDQQATHEFCADIFILVKNIDLFGTIATYMSIISFKLECYKITVKTLWFSLLTLHHTTTSTTLWALERYVSLHSHILNCHKIFCIQIIPDYS